MDSLFGVWKGLKLDLKWLVEFDNIGVAVKSALKVLAEFDNIGVAV
jgi:hypothetical protein